MLRKLLENIKNRIGKNRTLYPEVREAGGLGNAINKEFEKNHSVLRVLKTEADIHKNFVSYARVENGCRFSQIYIAAEKKLYLSDFWRDGVCLAHAQVNNLTDLVQVLGVWLCNEVTTGELSAQFDFVEPDGKAAAFDENREVEYTWNLLLNDTNRPEIKDIIELASRDEVLNKLFPYTSLYTLCFSRCTGYPYSYDLPSVTPKLDGTFIVRNFDKSIIGEGNVQEAFKLLKNNLPENLGPAIKGTQDDLPA